jgi:hypothetical protein
MVGEPRRLDLSRPTEENRLIRSSLVRYVSLSCVALVVAAAGSTSGSGAVTYGCFAAPGVLHGGVYKSRCFLHGLRIRVPRGWKAAEDSATELKFLPPHSKNPDTPAVRFWIDPHASTPCTDQPLSVDVSTPAKIVHWLRHNKNLVVSKPRHTGIGRGVAALTVDLDAARHAPRCSSSCPGPCLDYLLFLPRGAAPEPYGTARGELVRLYFARIRPPSHLFVFNVDTPNAKEFKELTRAWTRMLATVRLPAKLPSR